MFFTRYETIKKSNRRAEASALFIHIVSRSKKKFTSVKKGAAKGG